MLVKTNGIHTAWLLTEQQSQPPPHQGDGVGLGSAGKRRGSLILHVQRDASCHSVSRLAALISQPVHPSSCQPC